MHNLKPYYPKRLSFWLSITLLIFLACGPMYDLSEFVSYFQPESANKVDKGDEIYQYSPNFFYDNGLGYEYSATPKAVTDSEEVVKEWATYFKNQWNNKELATFLFVDSIEIKTPNFLKNNAETSFYFQKIKEQRQPNEEWNETIQKEDSLKNIENYAAFKDKFFKTKDIFLKQRFGYQAIRLAALNKQFKTCIDFYEQNFKLIETTSTVSIRAKAWVAGARIFAGNKAQAFYEFAQLFDKYPYLRTSSDLSVRTHNLHFSEEMLNFCRNNHEKMAVYGLASIQPNQDALMFIQKILELEPTYPMLEFLMAREINRNEYYCFSPENSLLISYENPTSEEIKKGEQTAIIAKSYFAKLTDLALKTTKNPKIINQAFWFTAAAYTAYVDKDFEHSKAYLAKAQALKPQKSELQNQLALQEMLLISREYKEATPEMETKIVPLLEIFNKRQNFRQTQALVKTSQLLSKMYKPVAEKNLEEKTGWWQSCSKTKSTEKVWFTKNNMPFAKAKSMLFGLLTARDFGPKNSDGYLISYSQFEDERGFLEDTTSAATMKELVTFLDQQNPNEVDKKLINLFSKTDFYEALGRRYLAEHHYDLAAKAFEKTPAETWKKERYHYYLSKKPFFVGEYTDAFVADTTHFYMPINFAKKMQELSLKKDAKALYYLGCGAYNISYWGNAWVLDRNWRSGSELEKGDFYGVNPYRNLADDFYQLKTAKKYFEEALSKTQDKEFQATIYYALALVERATYFLDFAKNQPSSMNVKDWDIYQKQYDEYNAMMEQKEKKDYRKNFSILRNNYRGTKFEESLQNSCGYYEDFITKK